VVPHTGDRGQVDGESINFLGRMTEMIKTSGANVAPAEVVLEPRSELDAETIRAELKDLSPFKI
jgi:acyl-CoA synthetase (AMP-forming)/AMP-acid ligase II